MNRFIEKRNQKYEDYQYQTVNLIGNRSDEYGSYLVYWIAFEKDQQLRLKDVEIVE